MIARNLLRRGVRTLLTVVGLSIGIAAVVALLGIAWGFERSFMAIQESKGIDRFIVSRLMHLGDAFTDLVERHRTIDIAAIGGRVLANCHYQVIWRKGGYLMVGQAPG